MTRVLALDPGAKFGWAAADIDDVGDWSNLEHGIMPAKDMLLTLAGQQLADGWSNGQEYDVIVYEDWRLYREHAEEYIGSDMPYSQYIGAVRLIGWLSNTSVIAHQAHRKKFALRQMNAFRPELSAKVVAGMERRHDDAHDMDAIIHLFAYSVDHYPVRKHGNSTN